MAQAFNEQIPAGDVCLKVRQRVCAWYSRLLGKTAADTARELRTVFGDKAIKNAAVRSLFRQFRDGRTEMNDLKRSGRPKVRTDDKVQQVKDIVKEKPNSTIHQIALRCGVSYSSVQKMLRSDLKLRKRASKLVPHDLTDLQKETRISLCVQFLQNCERKGWLSRVITADESWFHTINPNSKTGNMVWLPPGADRPQVPRRPMSAKKAMLICFFDHLGLLYSHWVINGTVTSAVYIQALKELRQAICTRRPRLWNRRRALPFLLHDDNASPHTSAPTVRH